MHIPRHQFLVSRLEKKKKKKKIENKFSDFKFKTNNEMKRERHTAIAVLSVTHLFSVCIQISFHFFSCFLCGQISFPILVGPTRVPWPDPGPTRQEPRVG